MLRILHVTNAYPYPDVPEYGIFIKEQIDSLDRIDAVENDFVFMNGRKDGKKAYLKGVAQVREKARSCDVIHCHHLYSSFTAAAAMTGKPRVVSFLNDWLHEMDGVSSEVARKIGCDIGVRWADRIIFKSPIPEEYRNDSRFIYLPNGTNYQQFTISDKGQARAQLGLKKNAIYLLFVSSKDLNRQQKRYDRFKSVLAQVRSKHPHLEIEELLLVNQPRDRVTKYFNAADVHVLTSDYEGSPNSVKEAVCCGVPVVTTNVGNVGHLLSNDPYSKVAKTFEVEELAALVGQLLNGEINRRAIREIFLSKNFSQESTALRLVEIYKEVIGRS